MTTRIIVGDALERLREMPDQSVHCIVTSPPYYGVRDYGCDGQIGLEQTPGEFVARLVEVFGEARRVLRDDGVLWINIGDSYAGSGKGGSPIEGKQATNRGSQSVGCLYETGRTAREAAVTNVTRRTFDEIKAKDLIGIPWMLAFALRDDGWWLRGDQIWAKPNGMPESVTDRPSRAHEYVFLLAKSQHYYYDQDAVRLPALESSEARLSQALDRQTGSARANGGAKTNGMMKAVGKQRGHSRRHAGFNDRWDKMERGDQIVHGANLRSVWSLPPAQFDGDHYAVMPDDLAAICIAAGCPKGGTVLDPFGGVGTTALVASRMQRDAILIELNPKTAAMAERRLHNDAPLIAALSSSDIMENRDG